MTPIAIGQPAPSFRLPAASGGEIGTDDFRGRANVVVWFTKGMACAFCRQQMSQLARGASQFRALNGEVLQVTLTPPPRARVYAEKFRLPFPYLCDPDYRVRHSWGLDKRSHPLLWYAGMIRKVSKWEKPTDDFGRVPTTLAEAPKMMADDDAGIFVLDRQGVVRYTATGAYVTDAGLSKLPSNEEIAAVLQECERVAARA